jgi:cysteine dioxygenase
VSSRPVDELCTALEQELARDPRGRGVARLLGDYARAHADWSTFACFDAEHYTRNLLHRCAAYELLLLCWESGQESPIHDHSGQDCWMAVLDGELEEQQYASPRPGAAAALVPTRCASFSRGAVAYIADGIALHRIRPLHGARGMSLHLYSRPIDTCRIYDAETGGATRVELGYFSVRGERCRESAAEVRAAWTARSR